MMPVLLLPPGVQFDKNVIAWGVACGTMLLLITLSAAPPLVRQSRWTGLPARPDLALRTSCAQALALSAAESACGRRAVEDETKTNGKPRPRKAARAYVNSSGTSICRACPLRGRVSPQGGGACSTLTTVDAIRQMLHLPMTQPAFQDRSCAKTTAICREPGLTSSGRRRWDVVLHDKDSTLAYRAGMCIQDSCFSLSSQF